MKKKIVLLLTLATVFIIGSSITAFASEPTAIDFTPVASSSSNTTPDTSSDPSGNSGCAVPVAAVPEEKPVSDPHVHSYSWQTSVEPTETSEGVSQYICACGDVSDEQSIAASTNVVKELFNLLENAPSGQTIIITSDIYPYQCYTAKMFKTLLARPDVTLKTIFTDKDGVERSFTLTAEDIKNETDLFYGFTYLGNTYGWDE